MNSNNYPMGVNIGWQEGKTAAEIEEIHNEAITSRRSIEQVLSDPNSQWKEKASKKVEEYNKAVETIKQKISEAAKLLKESEEIACSVDNSMYEMCDQDYNQLISPIWNELENIGWSTSSLGC